MMGAIPVRAEYFHDWLRWSEEVAMTNNMLRIPTTRLRSTGGYPVWARLAAESLVIAAALIAYFGVRGLTEGSEDLAVANAHDLLALEQDLGLALEDEIQGWIDGSQRLITLSNWIYIYGHWPVILVIGVWLFLTQPSIYYRLRNTLLLSGAVGLIIFATWPCAPPRLLDIGLADTVTEHSEGYRLLQPKAFTNQYAAMPSLHFGWNLLLAVGLFIGSRHLALKAFAIAMPIAMAFAVVATANHFILDPVAGGAITLAALYVIWYRLIQRGYGQIKSATLRTSRRLRGPAQAGND
jgi:hypothetical protein